MESITTCPVSDLVSEKYGAGKVREICKEVRNRELTRQQLRCFKFALGNDRLEHYNKLGRYYKSGISLDDVYNYFNNNLNNDKREKVYKYMIGHEFHIYLMKQLEKIGFENIRSEVATKSSRIDIVADLPKPVSFSMICRDGKYVKKDLSPGVHSFEAKAHVVLNDYKNIIRQIKSAKGKYKNVHVFVLADTKVSQKVTGGIHKAGGNIIKSDIRREQIESKINNMLKLFNKIKYNDIQ